MMIFSSALTEVFEQAGWYPGRRVELRNGALTDHPALPILSTFAGLKLLEGDGPGEEVGRSDVHFVSGPDVEGAIDIDDARELERMLGEKLLLIAETQRAHGQLYIGQSGRCFGVSLIHDATWFQGETFEQAITSLLVGLRPKPILLPSQDVVTLFGDDYGSDHKDLYQPQSP